MHHITSLIITLLVVYTSTFGYSQETNYRVQYQINKVIAKTGLNMRSEPTVKSKVITKLPFGVKVDFVDEKSYGLDTLQQFDDKQKSPIVGYWVKVSYKGMIGYVNNAYLYWNESMRRKDEDSFYYGSDFVFFEYKSTCRDNLYDLKKYQWYGYYSSDCSLRRINVSYKRNVLQMSDLSILVDDDEGLDWIVGTKGEFTTGPLDYVVKDFYFATQLSYDRETELYSDYTEPYYDVTYVKINQTHNFDLRIKHGGKTQIVMDAVNDGDLRGIIWMGDLDRDGVMDFIIQYGEKDYRSYLYLSTKGVGDQLVRPVARFLDGYCC